MKLELKQGNSLEVLKNYPDNTFDSVVTDPPYGLSFMGKKWDYDVPSVEIWKEVLRVLKPGGHLVSFSSSRTYHRMTVNVEDAGFEIRDQLMWLYGSGFPKSHNIGKSYDKKMGNEREAKARLDPDTGEQYSAGRLANGSAGFQLKDRKAGNLTDTKGTSIYEGWGTALKPAHEPIVLARKPLSEKTVVDNVIKWGTGGINIDGSRVSHTETVDCDTLKTQTHSKAMPMGGADTEATVKLYKPEGRFPANIIHDGSPEVLEGFPDAGSNWKKNYGAENYKNKQFNSDTTDIGMPGGHYSGNNTYGGETEKSAARFFYCAKVGKKERNAGLDHIEDTKMTGRDPGQDELNVAFKLRPTTQKNNHPTVKPVALMAYLCKLITPEGGTILDPFMGSGSTGMAAKEQVYSFTGIDLDADYVEIARARIDAW